ncbi:MAG: ATP:cob(I)alamin adenosyltransferase [Alphaproteobacteria bacterium RIFCSPLOWO2_01_FULL_45_8]|nr:MAG: ATP:cob(I)alamin adenosyltransferase [Alphaproteobacteria bacterium GWA1_45_9]OFW89392.1 MAG: ATP:cob(I)alamin adenosyltransferase [Alphaproteobacteria bacterium RIFCSPHIGHO2_01_FULL_41_14]OFW96336.1 MAG: ATP:cob(I)alamin adenosyltransferase [Alphaproteobacteria bacterium RIFCSPLOWO2_01_FULL_45_8]HCI48743.1 cob(I)yrinic acid a,c-diamide adenosyltransferase [Holosporales bacterium]
MVKLTKIYTRTGDKGTTSLGDGKRISKTSLRIQAIGSIDELNAALGVTGLFLSDPSLKEIRHIQNDLFDVGADLCIPEESPKKSLQLKDNQVQWLEEKIDSFNKNLAPLSSFILPGGSAASAHLHLSRTIARRAERDVIALSEQDKINPEVVMYLNRLSDYLFVLGRVLNNNGTEDVLWIPAKSQMERA